MATIIKRNAQASPSTNPAVRAVAFNYQEMMDQAEDYIASVRNEAAKIVQQAHADAARVKKEAEQAGRKAAEEAIERILDEKIAKQMATLKPALEQVARQLTDARGRWLDEWERGAVKLAARIAEKILHRELEQEPTATTESIREALTLAIGAADITLHLNPEDYEHLRSETSAIAQSLAELAPTQVVADPTISRGGCRVTTRFGEIDQRLETQLARIVEELTS